MRLKRLLLMLIAWLTVGWVQVFAQCGTITLSLEKVQDAACGSNGMMKMTVVEYISTTGRVITFELTGSGGGITKPESVITASSISGRTSVYYYDNLSAGNYTVTARKYCKPDWESNVASSEVSATMTIGSDHNPLSVTLEATKIRKPLTECFKTGIIPFTVTGGSFPYKIIIDDGPAEMIGKVYEFTEKTQDNMYTLYDLPVGNYTITVKDVCNYSVTREYDLTKVSDLSMSLVDRNWKLYIYWHKHSGINVDTEAFCNELMAMVKNNHSDLTPYMVDDETINRYFKFKWIIDTDPATEYSLDDGVQRCDTYSRSLILKLPDDKGYTYLLENESTITIYSEVRLPDDADISCDTYLSETGKQTFKLRNETYFSCDKVSYDGECHPRLVFPSNYSYNDNLRCFPITYTINRKKEDGSYEKVDDYSWDYIESRLVHDVGVGEYKIDYEDAKGATWSQEVTVGTVPGVIPNLARGSSSIMTRRSIPEDVTPTDEDKGTLVSGWHTFWDESYSIGVTVKYLQVPDNFHFKVGDTQYYTPIDLFNNSFYYNMDYTSKKWYQLFPGEYQFEFTTDCGVVTQSPVYTVYPASFSDENWEYEIVYDCNLGVQLRPIKAMINYPNGETSKNSQQYKRDIYVRIATLPDGTAVEQSYVKIDGTNTLLLPQKGEYRLEFTYDPNLLFHDENDWRFTRNITVDQEYFSGLYFDYTKTGAYKCPNDETATITAMAINGVSPYTYYLYDQEDRPDYSTSSAVYTLEDVAAGEVVSFSYGNVGEKYWVGVKDGCGAYFPQQVTVLTLDGLLEVDKNHDICGEKDVVLNASYISNATYTWYKGGNVENGEVKNGTIIEGATTETLKILKATEDDAGIYYVHIKHEGCGIDVIGTATLGVTPSAFYVKETATGDGSGRDWDNAHGDLADVLNIALQYPGCIENIYIAEGTYYPKYDPETGVKYDPTD
ncbi:immunoglobulin domain-containing protein, partial [Bacteroidales bacterium OttesenSCG-928-M11]|nr:immunoglobulin domain-containing protein [Bacteroidales bacterium OttesenSCG-928-M11]